MKSTRALIMILFSLLAGAVAVWLAARWAGHQAAGNTTSIVVAASDIDPGAPLVPNLLQQLAWPTGSIPAGAITDLKKVEGRVAGASMVKGEPLLEAKLAPEGSSGGLSAAIPTGKRAISIQVNEIVGVAGYIRPGSLVDVLINVREAGDRVISKIVLEQILVLAVAQDDKRDQSNKPKVVSTVTLEVSPQQAEQIDLARHIGTLSLVLRNPLDRAGVATAGARRSDLLERSGTAAPSPTAAASGAAPVAAPSPSRPRAPSTAGVEVIRGVQKANSGF